MMDSTSGCSPRAMPAEQKCHSPEAALAIPCLISPFPAPDGSVRPERPHGPMAPERLSPRRGTETAKQRRPRGNLCALSVVLRDLRGENLSGALSARALPGRTLKESGKYDWPRAMEG